MTQGLEKIATLDNEFEAQLLAEILRERGIVFVLKPYHDMAYDGLYTSSLGWAAVYGLPIQAETICSVLAEIRQAASEFDME